jgi:DNA repair protein RecO (recombination protein O)
MYRSTRTDAIVIRRERLAEFHKNLTLLTADLGLLRATAFGAYKGQSTLRMASEPFTRSLVSLYHDPVRGTYKVTEMEVRESYEGVRGDFGRVCAASLWAEVAQRSLGGGDSTGELYRLFVRCLRHLDGCDAASTPYLTAQYLWRFLTLAGYMPDSGRCERCGARWAQDAACFFEPAGHAFLCSSCARPSALPLSAGARRYLEASSALPLEEALRARLADRSLRDLEACLFAAVQAVLEGELKTLRFQGALP